MVFLQPMWINLRFEMSNFPLIHFVKFPACWWRGGEEAGGGKYLDIFRPDVA